MQRGTQSRSRHLNQTAVAQSLACKPSSAYVIEGGQLSTELVNLMLCFLSGAAVNCHIEQQRIRGKQAKGTENQ